MATDYIYLSPEQRIAMLKEDISEMQIRYNATINNLQNQIWTISAELTGLQAWRAEVMAAGITNIAIDHTPPATRDDIDPTRNLEGL